MERKEITMNFLIKDEMKRESTLLDNVNEKVTLSKEEIERHKDTRYSANAKQETKVHKGLGGFWFFWM